jgi:hypothetical protein
VGTGNFLASKRLCLCSQEPQQLREPREPQVQQVQQVQ